jgi:hypothetical protein
MKKILPVLLLIVLFISACNFPEEDLSKDPVVQTRVAVLLTQGAPDSNEPFRIVEPIEKDFEPTDSEETPVASEPTEEASNPTPEENEVLATPTPDETDPNKLIPVPIGILRMTIYSPKLAMDNSNSLPKAPPGGAVGIRAILPKRMAILRPLLPCPIAMVPTVSVL